jgi:hypothetical protein
MLDRVNEDLDTGSADLGCYWRFCRHTAGIAESEDGQDHRYIQPISGLVGRLDAIAAGRAGQGLHLMLSNTQCQPDGGFHWFAVAAWYTSASEAPIAAGAQPRAVARSTTRHAMTARPTRQGPTRRELRRRQPSSRRGQARRTGTSTRRRPMRHPAPAVEKLQRSTRPSRRH